MAYIRGIDVGMSCPATRSGIVSGRTLKLVMVGLLVGALIPLVVTIQGDSIRAFGDWVSDTASEGLDPPPGAVGLPGSDLSADTTDTGSPAVSSTVKDPTEVAQRAASAPEAAVTAGSPAPADSGAQRGGGTTPVPSAPADRSPASPFTDPSLAEKSPSAGFPQVGSLSVSPPRPPLVGSPPVGQLLDGSPLVGQPLRGLPSAREVPNPGLMTRPGIPPPQSAGPGG